jgi:hypothetical protein
MEKPAAALVALNLDGLAPAKSQMSEDSFKLINAVARSLITEANESFESILFRSVSCNEDTSYWMLVVSYELLAATTTTFSKAQPPLIVSCSSLEKVRSKSPLVEDAWVECAPEGKIRLVAQIKKGPVSNGSSSSSTHPPPPKRQRLQFEDDE